MYTRRAYAPKRLRVKTYKVEVEGEDVVVYLYGHSKWRSGKEALPERHAILGRG